MGGRAVFEGGGRSSLSQIAITGGDGSSSSSGGSSSSIMTSNRGGSSTSSSRGSSSSIDGSSNSSKITSIKGSSNSGRSSSGSQIYSKDGNLISIGKKIIYGGKSKKFSRQGDVETITVGRDEEERAKENFFSDGLLGKLRLSN